MCENWIETSRRRLLELQRSDGSWGYRSSTGSAAEPTALAGLALQSFAVSSEVGRRAADWLASCARHDGSLGARKTLADATWATPFAVLLWSAVGGYEDRCALAVAWLLKQKGVAIAQWKSDNVGHNAQLVGWPWISATHSWVEPTCVAVLALAREQRADDARCLEAARLIRDRAIPTGGWNYGNKAVFGKVLRPQPAPTGLALLALARSGAPGPEIIPALAYLKTTLAGTRAPLSLGWGILGLRVWGAQPSVAGEWLSEAAARPRIRDDVAGLSLLLLAANLQSLKLFGPPPAKKEAHRV